MSVISQSHRAVVEVIAAPWIAESAADRLLAFGTRFGSLEWDGEESGAESHSANTVDHSILHVDSSTDSNPELVVIAMASTVEDTAESSAWRAFWSRMAAFVAELIGTLILIVCGGSVQVHPVAAGHASTISLASSCGWAIGYSVALYIAKSFSAGHVDPAITLSMAVSGKLPWRRAPGYLAAQVLGALAGAGILYGVICPQLHSLPAGASPFIPAPASAMSTVSLSIIGSALLVIALSLSSKASSITVLRLTSPLLLGFVYFLLVASLGSQIGSALNPAADLASLILGWATNSLDGSISIEDYGINLALLTLGNIAGALIGNLLFDLLSTALDSLAEAYFAIRPAAPDSRVRSPEMSVAQFATVHHVISISYPARTSAEVDHAAMINPRQAPQPVGPSLAEEERARGQAQTGL